MLWLLHYHINLANDHNSDLIFVLNEYLKWWKILVPHDFSFVHVYLYFLSAIFMRAGVLFYVFFEITRKPSIVFQSNLTGQKWNIVNIQYKLKLDSFPYSDSFFGWQNKDPPRYPHPYVTSHSERELKLLMKLSLPIS